MLPPLDQGPGLHPAIATPDRRPERVGSDTRHEQERGRDSDHVGSHVGSAHDLEPLHRSVLVLAAGDDDRDLIGIGSVIVVVSMIMICWCWGKNMMATT